MSTVISLVLYYSNIIAKNGNIIHIHYIFCMKFKKYTFNWKKWKKVLVAPNLT